MIRIGYEAAAPFAAAAVLLSAASLGCSRETAGQRSAVQSEAAQVLGESAPNSLQRPLVTPAELASLVATPPPMQWFGVTLGARKIGHASLWLSRDERGISVRSTLVVARASEGTSLELTETRLYALRAPHRLVSIESFEETADGTAKISVTRRGAAMELRRSADGKLVSSGGIAASRETLLDAVSQSFVRPAWLERGRQTSVVELDTELGVDRETAVRVASRGSETVAGVIVETAEIELSRPGEAKTVTTIGGGGLVLAATVGGFAFVAQDARSARSGIVGLDLAASSVVIERPLGEPSALESATILIRPRPPATALAVAIPSAPNQRVVSDGNALRLELRRGPGAVVDPAARSVALRKTASADFADAGVSRLARKLRIDGDRRRTAEAINQWVFDNLEKRLSTDLGSASQILRKRVGDCTEHTLLFVALARAAGIPAREVSGLIYLGDERRAFGWHAWAEVALDGNWWPIDPSWGQDSVGPDHLTLGIGDDSRWIALIGGLEMEILSLNDM